MGADPRGVEGEELHVWERIGISASEEAAYREREGYDTKEDDEAGKARSDSCWEHGVDGGREIICPADSSR